MKEAEETEFVGQIIDIVDDFLEARNVSLPASEKAKEEDGIALNNPAVICGSDYDELADKFKGLLKSWAIVRQTPEQVEEDYRERERRSHSALRENCSMSKKISTNCCPHCGSKNVAVDADVRIRCHIEDGQIMLDDEYINSESVDLRIRCHIEDGQIMLDDEYINSESGSVLAEAVSEAGLDDLGGYCNDCGEYFDVDSADENGVYFTPSVDGRIMDKKYSETRDVLDTQAREDLSSFYDNLNDNDRNLFWSVLENVGCSEEFWDYYHSEWEPED